MFLPAQSARRISCDFRHSPCASVPPRPREVRDYAVTNEMGDGGGGSGPALARHPDTAMNWRSLAAWLPALILPTATLDQLVVIIRAESAAGVSWLSWLLFLVANLGALFLGRPENRLAMVQMGLAFGLTAFLDLLIVTLVLWERLGTG